MLQTAILGLRKWFALQRFPHEAKAHSFLYFDYYVMPGTTRDTIMIYNSNSATTMEWQKVGPLDDTLFEKTTIEMTASQKGELFHWLSQRLSNQARLWKFSLCKDATTLEIFCDDQEKSWKCSISIYGVQNFEEWRSLRFEFFGEAKTNYCVW